MTANLVFAIGTLSGWAGVALLLWSVRLAFGRRRGVAVAAGIGAFSRYMCIDSSFPSVLVHSSGLVDHAVFGLGGNCLPCHGNRSDRSGPHGLVPKEIGLGSYLGGSGDRVRLDLPPRSGKSHRDRSGSYSARNCLGAGHGGVRGRCDRDDVGGKPSYAQVRRTLRRSCRVVGGLCRFWHAVRLAPSHELQRGPRHVQREWADLDSQGPTNGAIFRSG